MRLFPLFCALLLTGCMRDTEIVVGPPPVPLDLLRPCPGHIGPMPKTEGQLATALIAEARGRACANARLSTIDTILNSEQPEETNS